MYRYFQNPFFNATINNFKRMLLMARDHRDKLMHYATTDAEINNLYNSFQTVFEAFEVAYDKISTSAGKYKGHTLMMENLLTELSSVKIRQWDIWIQNVYMEGTPEYAMLLPQNRKTFQSGAYDLRISTIKSLMESLKDFSALDNVRNDVESFYNKINKARTDQQKLETVDQSGRQDLEKARIKLAAEMHRIMGYLLYKHYESPEELSRYYELKYLQSPPTKTSVSLSSFSVAAGEKLAIFDGKLTNTSFITLKNSSKTSLKVYSSADAASTNISNATDIEAGETYTFYANEVNDGSGFNWVIVLNESNQAVSFQAGFEEVELE